MAAIFFRRPASLINRPGRMNGRLYSYCCLFVVVIRHRHQLELERALHVSASAPAPAPQRLTGPTGIPGSKVIKETWVYSA
jgi:hypothetical protein